MNMLRWVKQGSGWVKFMSLMLRLMVVMQPPSQMMVMFQVGLGWIRQWLTGHFNNPFMSVKSKLHSWGACVVVVAGVVVESVKVVVVVEVTNVEDNMVEVVEVGLSEELRLVIVVKVLVIEVEVIVEIVEVVEVVEVGVIEVIEVVVV